MQERFDFMPFDRSKPIGRKRVVFQTYQRTTFTDALRAATSLPARRLRAGFPRLPGKEVAGRTANAGVRSARNLLLDRRGGFDRACVVGGEMRQRCATPRCASGENRLDRRGGGLAAHAAWAQASTAGRKSCLQSSSAYWGKSAMSAFPACGAGAHQDVGFSDRAEDASSSSPATRRARDFLRLCCAPS